MFGFIADILTSVVSILFPIFASYKALRSSDPASLSPWLMYWTTLSLFILVENQFYWILYWIPFYSWIRFGMHLYLVQPGNQGCVAIYQQHIHPFLEEHERQIDQLITEAHAKARAVGLDAVKQLIEVVRVKVLGQEPRRPTPPASRNVSYSQNLLSRFNLPSARDGLAAAGTSDLFSLLGKAMNQSTYPNSTTRDAQARDLADSGSLIPPNLSGTERSDFVNTQRDRLQTLLKAFDAEAYASPGAGSSTTTGRAPPSPNPARRPKTYLNPSDDYLHKSRSESEFEDLAYETMPDPAQFRPSPRGEGEDFGRDDDRRSSKGNGWGNFIWGNYGEKDSAIDSRKHL
ncbi:hypothetical protein K431DRAFT_282018 [Polychaeton citri CBS 116435]|uniref:Protein YOP1 n=1 Tax=Polychaeton citri CBS 116435 TaxID=1314669 RepID=A0A9P4UTC4_9PEZI|nr:hypothetical protein K431DRAFT_282018 [Polychaeton citri CBS 116435]